MSNIVKQYAEIVKNFVTPDPIKSKNRFYVRWDRGLSYVEVQLPGFKIGKQGTHEKRPWVVSSFIIPYRLKNGRTAYKQITSSCEYSKQYLTDALKELNRPYQYSTLSE